MAIFTPGPAVAAVSGSVGGTVFSRNAGGAYMRIRAVPTTSTTADALAAKARMTTQSQGWRALTDAQRTSWRSFSLQNPVPNALGFPNVLQGNAMFIRINTLLEQSGNTTLTEPPTAAPPTGLLTLVVDADIGVGDVEIVFTATPLAATTLLVVRSYVTNSTAIQYVDNNLRTVQFSADAQASPLNIQAAVETKFGTLVVGQTLHVNVFTLDSATGLRSSPLRSQDIVTS